MPNVGPLFSSTGSQNPTKIMSGSSSFGNVGVKGLRKASIIKIVMTGGIGTAVALDGWQGRYKRAIKEREGKMTEEMMRVLEEVIRKGRSKKRRFEPVGKSSPGVFGSRRRRGVRSTRAAPFASSGKLITYFRARAKPEEKGFSGDQMNVRMTYDVPNPRHRPIVAALIKGSIREVGDISVSKAIWAASGGKRGGTFYPPGAILVTPARDFLRGAAEDATPAVKKYVEDAVKEANLKTNVAMPAIIAAKTDATILRRSS